MMSQGKREMSRSSAKQSKRRIMTAIQIIGLIGSLITIFMFLQSVLFPSGSKEQNAKAQASDNSQAGVFQTKNGDVNVQLSAAHESSKDFEDIHLLSYRQLLAKSYDLVRIARETGQYDEAISIIKEMVKIEDIELQSMSILQYNLGLLLYDSGEIGAAQEAFREAIRGGGFASAFYCLGITCIRIEEDKTSPDYQEAIEAFTQAIEDMEKPEYYHARAWAYKKSGLLEKAEQDLASEKNLLTAQENAL